VSEESKRVFVRVMEEAFNRGNLDVVDELVAPDFFSHEAPDARGPEGFKATPRWLRAAFPDLHAEHWACRDDLGQFAQLGLTPPSAGA
jgi:SnoaL-like polyketide cyclase